MVNQISAKEICPEEHRDEGPLLNPIGNRVLTQFQMIRLTRQVELDCWRDYFRVARLPPSMAASAIGLIDEPGTSEYAPPASHWFPSMRSRISGSSGRTSDKGESAMKRKVTYSAAVLLLLVVGVAWAQRTDVSRLFPIYNNEGKPDLTVDPKRFISQMEIVDRFFDSSSCELIEGSIGGTGYRRLLRFDTVLINGGDGDL